jgi:hypothetical protein
MEQLCGGCQLHQARCLARFFRGGGLIARRWVWKRPSNFFHHIAKLVIEIVVDKGEIVREVFIHRVSFSGVLDRVRHQGSPLLVGRVPCETRGGIGRDRPAKIEGQSPSGSVGLLSADGGWFSRLQIGTLLLL